MSCLACFCMVDLILKLFKTELHKNCIQMSSAYKAYPDFNILNITVILICAVLYQIAILYQISNIETN